MTTTAPNRKVPERFLVAFSFAGEQRAFVRSIAEAVEKILGPSAVFFDEWFEALLAGADADLELGKIYGERAALVVLCISAPYGKKPWTLSEYEGIRSRIMKARASSNERDRLSVLPLRVGDGDVPGIHFTAIVPDVRERPPERTAALIVERLRLVLPDLVIAEP